MSSDSFFHVASIKCETRQRVQSCPSRLLAASFEQPGRGTSHPPHYTYPGWELQHPPVEASSPAKLYCLSTSTVWWMVPSGSSLCGASRFVKSENKNKTVHVCLSVHVLKGYGSNASPRDPAAKSRSCGWFSGDVTTSSTASRASSATLVQGTGHMFNNQAVCEYNIYIYIYIYRSFYQIRTILTHECFKALPFMWHHGGIV